MECRFLDSKFGLALIWGLLEYQLMAGILGLSSWWVARYLLLFCLLAEFPRYSRILEAAYDEYDGVIIGSEGLPESPVTFVASLRASLSHWKSKGKKGIWLKLPRERSDLVPIAEKEGFEYHHAEKGYVMLTYWIPEGPCMLPANASHQVGVGGLMRFSLCKRNIATLTFMITGGFIHESEEIYDGAVREIDMEFVEVIAFRHTHNVAFEKSDLFFICMLRPLSTEIKWMPLDEFVEQPTIRSDNMFNKITGIWQARVNKNYCGLAAHTVVSKFDGRSSSLYYNTTEDDQEDHNCLTK